MRRLSPLSIALLVLLPLPGRISAQGNILLPVDSIERLLRLQPFEVLERRDTRFEGDRTQSAVLLFRDSSTMKVKWAQSRPGGQAFNNQPRFEIAAYELQKLFLDEADFVVPPTVARALPLEWYRTLEPGASATFDRTSSVLVVLQYWLSNVTDGEVFDRRRLAVDTAYARNLGNLNILTYLIRHSDANQGNMMISRDSLRPRLFAVDNGVAFSSEESDRGTVWRRLRTDRLPRSTVERLRKITREELDRALEVVAQFEVRDDQLVPVPPGARLARGGGVRRDGAVLQLGLTSTEIAGVHARLTRLLRSVDAGRVQTF